MATVPQFASRPEVEVIIYRHKPACRFTALDKLGRCACRKHLYIRAARLHISTDETVVGSGREFATRWQDAHDPAKVKEREQANHKLVENAFDDFISAKKAASDNPDGLPAPHLVADKLISLFFRQVDLASARESLCRSLGSRWFTERFHRNALVTHFQHGQVFCTARQLKDYAVTR